MSADTPASSSREPSGKTARERKPIGDRYAHLGTWGVTICAALLTVWWTRAPARPSLADALALIDSRRFDEAVSRLKEISAAEPSNVAALANLCGLYLEMNHPSEARDACARAITLAPNDWFANYNQACVWARDGRTLDAIRALGLALAHVADDRQAPLTKTQLAQKAQADPMLRALQTDAAFKTLLATP